MFYVYGFVKRIRQSESCTKDTNSFTFIPKNNDSTMIPEKNLIFTYFLNKLHKTDIFFDLETRLDR